MIFLRYYLNVIFFIILLNTQALADVINKINVDGNQRISNNTVILFSEVYIGQEVKDNDLNLILRNLYSTKYFEDVKLLLENNVLNISVKEYPIIQNINYNGVKSSKILENITADKLLMDNFPYNFFSLKIQKI